MNVEPTIRPIDHDACGLYKPGHQVHFIQAKKAWEGDQADYRNGTVLKVDDEGWITVQVGDEAMRFWNHDPARARECFAASEGRVGLPGWSLLYAPSERDRYYICVSTDGPTPCVPPASRPTNPAELAKQLETYGGFLAPGGAILGDPERDRGG